MYDFLKKWDVRWMTKHPKLWVLGVHVYPAVLIVLAMVIYGGGWLVGVDPLPNTNSVEVSMNVVATLVGIVAVLLAILYIIRQLKFNNTRIHHKLPYKHSALSLVTYFVLFSVLCMLPFIFQAGVYHKLKANMDTEQFIEDYPALIKGIPHIAENQFTYNYQNDNDERECQYFLSEDGKVLNYLNDYYVNYHVAELCSTELGETHYRNKRDISISYQEAIKNIEQVIPLLERYESSLRYGLNDAKSVMAFNLDNCAKSPLDVSGVYRLAVEDQYDFYDQIRLYEEVIERDSYFYVFNSEFWLVLLGIALVLSMILILITHTAILDFGWGFLAASLYVTVYSILIGISFIGSSSEVFVLSIIMPLLMLLFLGAITIAAFMKSSFSSAVKRAHLVTLNILSVPAFVLFITWIHEVFIRNYFPGHLNTYSFYSYILTVIFAVGSTLVFAKMYQKTYVHPQD